MKPLSFTGCFSVFIFFVFGAYERKTPQAVNCATTCCLLYDATPYPVTLRAKTVFIVQVPFGTKMAAMPRRSGRSRVCATLRGGFPSVQEASLRA